MGTSSWSLVYFERFPLQAEDSSKKIKHSPSVGSAEKELQMRPLTAESKYQEVSMLFFKLKS